MRNFSSPIPYYMIEKRFLLLFKLIFWTPSYGHSKRGRKCTTYSDSIVKDLDQEPNQIQQLMMNTTIWRKFVSAASTIPFKDDT